MTDTSGPQADSGLEKALETSELRLRQIIDAMPHMMWMATVAGDCIFLSKRWEEYTGIAAVDQLGYRWTAQLHEEDRPQVRAAWESAVASGLDFHLNCRIRRFDGAYRWFETRGLPLRDPQGHIVKWFGTNTDVHDTYEARRQLAENEERLRYVALATHDSIYDWDMRVGITYRNDRFQKLFAAPASARSSDRWWENRIHPDDRQRIVDSAAAAFRARLPTWNEEYRLLRADGAYAIVNDRAYLLYNAKNKPVRMIGAIADITARKQADQSLRDARARLQSAMEAGGLATWIWDVKTNQMEWDEAACRLWGQPLGSWTKFELKQLRDLIHPDDLTRLIEFTVAFRNGGSDAAVEFRTKRPDGALQWLLSMGKFECDAAGNPIRMAGVYIDVTARRQIEQDLRDSQARLKSAMQAGGLATWAWDGVTNTLLWDEDTNRLWGRKPGEFSALSFAQLLELIHPDDRFRLAGAIERFGRNERNDDATAEFRVLRPDGTLQWLATMGQIELDTQGKPARAVGVYLDVTERKKIEQSLRDTQARLESAMGAAGLATWMWNIARDEFVWDDAAYRLWGRRADELGKISSADIIAMMHPEDQARITSARNDFIKHGDDSVIEFRVVLPDNTLKWMLAKGKYDCDDHDRPTRMVGVYLDITERKQAEEARLQSQKMEALGTLAGGIAHDFNNILLAIVGNAKLASTDLQALLQADHPVRRNLQEIEKAASRATALVKRILTFSRQQDSKREAMFLRPLVEEALRLLRPSLPATVEIRMLLENDAPPVACEAIQIQQIVMNLVTNAAHAIGDKPGVVGVALIGCDIREGDPAVPKELSAGRYACLTVSDSGGGIDEAIVDRIFDPFFTTKEVGHGTGLGLAVVHGIVRAHGGAIAIETQLGSGSTFRVYFPADSGAVKSPIPGESLPQAARGERVLYVDDEESLVFLISRVLERLGYRVTGCLDPVQALAQLRANPNDFDVVVTDLSMRGMNGFELTREIAKIRADLPVLLTSGYLRSEDRELAAQVGIRELILKPNTVEELGHAIDRTLVELRAQAVK